jgi:putative flippase GtrA
MNQRDLFSNEVLRQIRTFCFIGLFNFVINYSVFYIFLDLCIDYKVAGVLGFLAGGISGFFLNRKFTFDSSVSGRKGIPLYFMVQIVSLFGHMITQWYVVEFLYFDFIYSQFSGIITSTMLNFTLLKLIVFKPE